MVKATEGITFLDQEFPRNWEQMKAINIRRFAYHFARPTLDHHSPVAQAQMFTKVVRAQGLDPHDHFVLDLEETGGMAPLQVSFWAWTFRQEIFRLNPGHRCLVYTYPAFADEGNCSMLGQANLWLAEYNVPAPRMPVGPWHHTAFWQTGGTGLDRDEFMLGNSEELTDFCAT
jgi:GH25 family lysozyme M1 (1,4-beta-N-acetylmuramidase)